ncbi:MAG TPA: acetolactate synthase [Acidimicrobiia bacterium]|nr:acetolactate synthase [Acidimicrobiia bacterium]
MSPPDAGHLAAATLQAHDVDTVFTLNGGHLWPLYYGCAERGVRLVDTRHEQTAAFAAEGWAKVTRRVGVAALTAGPGVTNGVSAITTAFLNGSPVTVIGGRAPQARWGSGSLQELDHVPIVASVTKQAGTAGAPDEVPGRLDAALRAARTPHRGPTFVDVPLDCWGPSDAAVPDPPDPSTLAGDPPDPDALAQVARLVGRAHRPVLMAGADVYWAGADAEVGAFADAARIPVFVNDMARGVIPADDPLAFSRARGLAFAEADLVIVGGTPLDFRLGFGVFGDAAVVHLRDAEPRTPTTAAVTAEVTGDLRRTFAALAEHAPPHSDGTARAAREDWLTRLRADERTHRAADEPRLGSATTPIDPVRVYGELRRRLERDAIVVGDGGDFVSYAGRYIDTFTPGGFIGPGPYGCLGAGMGYALGAALASPDRQVVALFGDGALGFTLGDLDTLARHAVNVTVIVGNNGIWGLEKHPMQLLYGEDLVADLAPETRYDLAAAALGMSGELVRDPAELGAALDRALADPGPTLVNVLTDPADAYPRRSNLA